MAIVIGLSLALILAGLVMAWLSPGLKYPSLVKAIFVVGVVLVIIGLILLLAPVFVWVAAQLRAMLGQ